MILGYHISFSAYGFWLPNDPRGSGSDYVGSSVLFAFGPATGLDNRSRSVAATPHDREKRTAAKAALKYPSVQFTDLQMQHVGTGFGNYIDRAAVEVWACTIMPDHVHLVTGLHRLKAESIVTQLKGSATRELVAHQCHPLTAFADPGTRPPTCWGGGDWIVYLDSPDAVRRCICYVEENPVKAGRQRQVWPFVVPYLG